MKVFHVRNAHEAVPLAYNALMEYGVRRESRAGSVLVVSEPVTTVYDRPLEKVVLWPERDANPFFHLFEGLWMLAGRRDVEYVRRYNGNIAKVASDDGVNFHGAYGYRWRKHFGFDQLEMVIARLKKNPDDRRVILQMWDPKADLNRNGLDFPCNQSCHLEINTDGQLDLKVFCRSNDAVWGTYGSDSVDFAMLQEYTAAGIGCHVGRYWQISSNWHAYVETVDKLKVAQNSWAPYSSGEINARKMVNVPITDWDRELGMFLEGKPRGYTDQFFSEIAWPMAEAWEEYKAKRWLNALALTYSPHVDWLRASHDWINRRYTKWLAT